MKNKINIFLDTKIKLFLIDLFSDYELSFTDLNEIQKCYENTGTNIIFLSKKDVLCYKRFSQNYINPNSNSFKLVYNHILKILKSQN